MKKAYIKPAMRVVPLQSRPAFLLYSGGSAIPAGSGDDYWPEGNGGYHNGPFE